MSSRFIIQLSKAFSAIFSPFYAPTWAFLWLLMFSYLRMWPWEYKAFIVTLVILFTIIVPRITIDIFRRINRWSHWQLSHRRHRHMPYFITLASYVACVTLLLKLNTAVFMRGIIIATIATTLLCSLVNLRWKVSTHMAGMGGLCGTVIAFSYLFYFNPLLPFCCMLLLSGCMGSARMVLHQHNLEQEVIGFLIGFLNALVFILFVWV